MTDDLIYTERVSSPRTALFFAALTVLFTALSVWRARLARGGRLRAVFSFLAVLFLFYVLNYRTLVIRLTPATLKLRFGLFTWNVPLENVASCCYDELPTPMRLGGAGIHFMMVRHRYRVLFNFLEHPRVVVALKKKAGPVQDVSFSTRQPDQVLLLIQAAVAATKAHTLPLEDNACLPMPSSTSS